MLHTVADTAIPLVFIWKRLQNDFTPTKKYSCVVKRKRSKSVLSLEGLCYLRILNGCVLDRITLLILNYTQFLIPHIVIRIPKWRRYFKPKLSRKIPFHLAMEALYTKLDFNSRFLESTLSACYSKIFERKLTFDSEGFIKFLKRPYYRKSSVLSYQHEDLLIARIERIKQKTLTLIFYRNIFYNISGEIKHILHVYSGARTRSEFLCF